MRHDTDHITPQPLRRAPYSARVRAWRPPGLRPSGRRAGVPRSDRRAGTGSWWPFSGAGCACSDSVTGCHARPAAHGRALWNRSQRTGGDHRPRSCDDVGWPGDTRCGGTDPLRERVPGGSPARTAAPGARPGAAVVPARGGGGAAEIPGPSPGAGNEPGRRAQRYRGSRRASTIPSTVSTPHSTRVNDSGTEEPPDEPTSASAPMGSSPPATAVPNEMHRPVPV